MKISESERTDKLQKIVTLFLQKLPQRLELIRNARAELETQPSGSDAQQDNIETLRSVTHNLAGTAGSLGFDSLSTLARALEQELRQLNYDNDNSLSQSLDHLRYAVDCVETEILRILNSHKQP